MSDALRHQLQSTLGAAYTLERELGGGGMSRVFVAREDALGRDVVVKVLHPELAGGVSTDRFKREIALAASLQHPHIVPILSAGDADGLPYYTMPFVQGRSLRERLAEQEMLPLAETVSILRDVARALAFAHGRGVVHRDIKPDNVLLAEGSATVTDFGVAKAISAAKTVAPGGTLTGIGTSIGTPAYMAPEQAAGDPDTDHRADIYAFGCMAYEMLAGRTPFAGRTPHRLLAAHMSETAAAITEHRPDTPPALASLVMRCLEKELGARPQSAAEMLQTLESVGTPSAGGHEALPAISIATRRMLGHALGLYAAAFVLVAAGSRAAVAMIGLPDWVFPAALIAMALGLPVILFTALVHHQSRVARTMAVTRTPGGTPTTESPMARLALKASPFVTWRRTALGGVLAVGAVVLLTAGYMTLRAFGIGPAGSLMAAGVIGEKDRLLVTDFRSPAGDSTLGPVVTEAIRTDLGQSRAITVVQSTAVRDVLVRMQRPADARVDLRLAREIGTREGIKAVLDGDIGAIGKRYMLSIRLHATETGDVLASFRETADDADDIIPAIERLSKKLRGKLGESLRTVHATPPLEQVTTSSLEALRKFVQGNRAADIDRDLPKAVALLEEAIALDTGFAMAYRKLGIALGNTGGQRARQMAAIQKAYDHRDRLSDAERYLTIGTYHFNGPQFDPTKAIAAYEALLEINPNFGGAINNLGILYSELRDYRKSEQLYRRAMAADSTVYQPYANIVPLIYTQGRPTEAWEMIQTVRRRFPNNPLGPGLEATFAWADGQYDSADARIRRRRAETAGNALAQRNTGNWLRLMARARGQLADAREWAAQSAAAAHSQGDPAAELLGAIEGAWTDVWFLDRKAEGLAKADAALAKFPLASIPADDRPYFELAVLYASGGRPERARALLAEWGAQPGAGHRKDDEIFRQAMIGNIALAEGRAAEAVQAFRAADLGACFFCGLPDIARAYDVAGQPDSALATYERYVSVPRFMMPEIDADYLAGSYKRLGELYEARNQPGDREKAASSYARFVDLWKNAVGSSRVDLQACKLEYSIVSPK